MADEDIFTVEEEENENESKYLLCKLGDEEYGINITCVQGIEELQKIVHVPDLPEYVKGVINMRGKIIPVIDLRLKFNMAEREYDDRTCIILTRIKNSEMGLIVDTVSEVLDIPEKDINPPPSFRSSSEQDRYISGLGKIEEEVKILLDVEKLLHEHEVEHIQESANNQPIEK